MLDITLFQEKKAATGGRNMCKDTYKNKLPD
jgi:hypothetical protein